MRFRSIVGLIRLRLRGPFFLGLTVPRQSAGTVVLDIAHKRQGPYMCVPTCASMALDYYGERVSPACIRAQRTIANSSFAGMYFDDLVVAMDVLGHRWFTASYEVTRSGFTVGLQDIVRSLRQGRPVLVELHSAPIGHAVLVHGFDARRQTISWVDPDVDAPGRIEVSWATFAERWQSVNSACRGAVFTLPGTGPSPNCRRRAVDRGNLGAAIVGPTDPVCHRVLELRRMVLAMLADSGFAWPSDFGAVDLRSDGGAVEVSGIRTEDVAAKIGRLLHREFPLWRFPRTSYEARDTPEPGWKVVIVRSVSSPC